METIHNTIAKLNITVIYPSVRISLLAQIKIAALRECPCKPIIHFQTYTRPHL